MGILSDFIKEWEEENAKKEKIRIFRIGDDEKTYLIEIRYSATLFKCIEANDFTKVVNSIGRQSGGTLRIYSDLDDFNTGAISIRAMCCNHSYNERQVVRALEHLFEILKDLRKAPLS